MSGPVFVALVNPKSGGNVGASLLSRFKEILDEERVYNLSEDGGPKRALVEHCQTENLRIIACGGDGTVGWILSVMDSMKSSFPRGRRPAIGIIPLGTGNDLSRSLNWGGKYRDKPLRKVLIDIAKADVVSMDRWALNVSENLNATTSSSIPILSSSPSSRRSPGANSYQEDVDGLDGDSKAADSKLPMNVLNNYFSVGIDAHIALQFHRARNNNPEHFKSRTRNLLYYGLEGGKDLFKQQWRNLMDYVTIECDGVDFTHRLKAYGTHSVLFLNIKSYAGGTRPWNNKSKGFGVQDMNDGLLEVVAIDNLDLAILHAGGSGASVCQCRTAVITTTKDVPMQVDGEPVMMKPCRIEISLGNHSSAPSANMLVRNKNATYAVRDDEIETWAAKTIQHSFKQYKKKALSQEVTET